MSKVKKAKYQYDSELKKVKQVAETQEAFDNILKDAKVTRVANKGDKFITQTINFSVAEIEVDWDSIVYKYIFEGEEHFSNFKFNNPVETILPKINPNDTATA